MTYTPNDLETLLYSIPENRGLMGFLSVQEIEQLAFICWQVLVKIENSQNTSNSGDYNLWAKKASQDITAELKDAEDEDIFGITDLGHRLNMAEFLKKVYTFDRVS